MPQTYKARVFVTLKPSVFDPQGHVIVESLHGMGYGAVNDVRQGKYFELDVQADSPDAARAMVGEVSNRLLANPVIESYRVDLASGPRDV
jgi:phosphoribosylformylglycinamidine synthase